MGNAELRISQFNILNSSFIKGIAGHRMFRQENLEFSNQTATDFGW